MKGFKINHTVCFEETNLVGNVYFVNHIKWQGRCREMFILEHAPDVLKLLEEGHLSLVTLSCSCEYYDELKAFDEVIIYLHLESINQNKIKMLFNYYKNLKSEERLIAQGSQTIACMAKNNNQLEPVCIPNQLNEALHNFI